MQIHSAATTLEHAPIDDLIYTAVFAADAAPRLRASTWICFRALAFAFASPKTESRTRLSMFIRRIIVTCHPERSEGSQAA